jgi:CheY-like chemotaxis protein
MNLEQDWTSRHPYGRSDPGVHSPLEEVPFGPSVAGHVGLPCEAMERVQSLEGPGLNIVLIDPHEGVRANLARRLRSDERVASLAEASSVANAAATIESSRPHVVIIDPGTFEGTGRAALQSLWQLREQTEWFLIAVHTASGEQLPDSDANQPGSDLYLLKGVRTAQLVAALVHGLSEGHSRKSLGS